MIRISVSRADATVLETETLTAGRIGLVCEFVFSSDWDDLEKVAVFDGEVTKEVMLDENNRAIVPAECMATAGYKLRCGVTGLNAEQVVVLPTVYVNAGKIRESAEIADSSIEEITPSLASQVISRANEALRVANELASDAESGAFDGEEGPQGPKGETGEDGFSPEVSLIPIKEMSSTSERDGVRITVTQKDGTSTYAEVWDGLQGPTGPSGAPGPAGKDGTATDEQVETFVSAWLTDHSAEIKGEDGKDGKDGATGPAGSPGAPGAAGADGYSPTVAITQITDGHRVTITDKTGAHNFDVMDGEDGADGVSPTIAVSEITGGHVLTITDKNGTRTVNVLDGEDGATGPAGTPGAAGADGYSPLVSVAQTSTGATITVTDKNGTTSASVDNGSATDAQVEAWLDAHPEATTSVQDGSITQKKMAFPAFEGEISPNLIDESLVTSARFTNANGSIQSFTEGSSYYNYWRMTDYIDVTEHIGDCISITNHNGYCFYTADKTAIAGSGEGLGMGYPANSSKDPILIPSGASYVRLVYWYRDEAITAPMANFGTTLKAYQPFGKILLPQSCVFNATIGEKIDYENFEHDIFVQKVVSNNLASPIGLIKDCSFNRTTGEEESRASGYSDALTDWIRVKPDTNYYGRYKNVAFYDADKNYLGWVGSATPFKTYGTCAYVRLNVDGADYGSYLSPHYYYLVEGDARPASVEPAGEAIPSGMLERFSVYQSVLKRMAPLYNPTIKTAVGIYGDSNTAGLETGSTGRYYQNCWANLLCQRITEVFDQDVTLYPYGKYGSWQGGSYSGTILLNDDPSFVSLSFYGATLKVNFGQVNKGVALLSIDGGEPVSYDTNTGTQYLAEGLTEAEHSLLITRSSGTVQVSSIVIHKHVTAANKGSTGSGTSYLPREDKTYDLYIAVLGTNDRGGGRTPSYIFDNCYNFTAAQMKRGAEVILVTPTPATDGFETGASAGIKMADVESAISSVCGTCNLEPISFYQFLLNYCANTGTELNSLFNDTLHMKESTHALIFKFMCDKLGLGQPIADYLP